MPRLILLETDHDPGITRVEEDNLPAQRLTTKNGLCKAGLKFAAFSAVFICESRWFVSEARFIVESLDC